SQPVTDALEAARGLAHPAEQPERPIERLRDLSRAALRSGQPRNPTSLRHTGLIRPVSRMETAAVIPINPDNSDHRRVDSAKTGPQNHTTGQSGLGGGTYLGDGIKAEGN
ncbi:MAG TPA: hypothetical protein GYA10_14495, partial [Alphaproteobacteria bacterium]|nr:hypothetical protein [Alphaproteobacteria bacterium]